MAEYGSKSYILGFKDYRAKMEKLFSKANLSAFDLDNGDDDDPLPTEA